MPELTSLIVTFLKKRKANYYFFKIEKEGNPFNTFWHTGYGYFYSQTPSSPDLGHSQTSSAMIMPVPSAADFLHPRSSEPAHSGRKPSPHQSWQRNGRA